MKPKHSSRLTGKWAGVPVHHNYFFIPQILKEVILLASLCGNVMFSPITFA